MRKFLLPLLAMALTGLFACWSCAPDGLTDKSVSLYYPGIADIGPSTNMNLTPTWHGGTPEGFEIYRVTLDGELFETESFTVDPDNGEFFLRNTAGLPVGLYSISISALFNGKRHEFPDVITVNMMKPVPDGISVEPSRITLKYTDVTDVSSSMEFPEAKIVTDGEHISIKKYLIANVRRNGEPVADYKEYFSISDKGVISVLKNENFVPGEYVFDFKLTTYVVNEESQEGLFENALTVDITSGPLSVVYTPDRGKVEAGYSFASAAPEVIGSYDGLTFLVKKVTPEGAPVSVDPETGAVIIPADHNMPIGSVCTVDIIVTNHYGSADFDNVYTVEVVEYINPISSFSYGDVEVMQMVKLKNTVSAMDGDDVTYELVDLPDALSSLSIDLYTGEISAPKGHDIPLGEYEVKVLAKNVKGELATSFRLKVVENPYYFTSVYWGNNLGLSPVSDYASQYRISGLTRIPVQESDIKPGTKAVYSVKGGSTTTGITIDGDTGEITVNPEEFTSSNQRLGVHFTFVTVTTGSGTDAEVSLRFPVFFNYYDCFNQTDIKIDYVPFVFQCNPATGGRSSIPSISGGSGFVKENFTLDFRRTFQYYNFNGPSSHVNGQPSAAGSLMNTLWTAFGAATNWPVNTGARAPLSAWDGKSNTLFSPCYIRKSDLALVVNPDKWKDENGYANGIFIGQTTYATTGADPQSGTGIFPIAVWFDTRFDNE